MALQVAVVVGNPKPRSRTLAVASALAGAMFAPPAAQLSLIDLADHTDEILTWPSERMDNLNKQVATSDVAFVASPTYKASYTGLLKAFLDRYPANGLAGVTAIPVMTGADKTHSMGPTVNLSPLLMELGAVVPGRGFYFVIDQMDHMDSVVAAAAETYLENLARLSTVAASSRRSVTT